MNRDLAPRHARKRTKSLGQQYLETFGEVLGAKYYAMGLTWSEAKTAYTQQMRQQKSQTPPPLSTTA